MSTAPWDQPRNATTVTVTVSNPFEATDEELIAALDAQCPSIDVRPLDEHVDYVNWRKPDGRVCFGVSWRNPNYRAES